MNVNGLAGGYRSDGEPCFSNECYTSVLRCSDPFSCHYSLDPCYIQELFPLAYDYNGQPGNGTNLPNVECFFSVYAPQNDFFSSNIEFALTVDMAPNAIAVRVDGTRFEDAVYPALGTDTYHNWVLSEQAQYTYNPTAFDTKYFFGGIRHYRFDAPTETRADSVVIRISDVINGYLTLYVNLEAPAGFLPCYENLGYTQCGREDECTSDNNKNMPLSCEWPLSPCDISNANNAASPDDPSVGAVYYFSVYGKERSTNVRSSHYAPIMYQVEVALEQPPEAIITTTNRREDGEVFTIGFSSDLRDPLSIDSNLWLDWAESVAINNNVIDNNGIIHYRVDVAPSPGVLVWVILDEVAHANCLYADVSQVSVSLFYTKHRLTTPDNLYGRSVPCDTDCGTVLLCDAVSPDQQCVDTLPECYNRGSFYLHATGHSELQIGNQIVTRYLNPITFNIKAFQQTPIVLEPSSSEESVFVSSYYGIQQRFVLDGVETEGYAPINRIVFHDLFNITETDRLWVWIHPSTDQGAGEHDDELLCFEDCAKSKSCIEVRHGLPEEESTFFYDNIEHPYRVECTDVCTITLLPCLLKEGYGESEWSMSVYSSAEGYSYRVYWQALPSQHTITEISPELSSDTRALWPASSLGVEPALTTLDETRFFSFTVPSFNQSGIREATFSGVASANITEHDYQSLTIETYFVNGNTEASVFITRQHLDASHPDPVVRANGTAPLRPLLPDNALAFGELGLAGINNACSSGCSEAYFCHSAGATSNQCNGDNAFHVPFCCLESGATYVIGVRQLGAGSRSVRFRVRLVSQKQNAPHTDLVSDVEIASATSTTPVPYDFGVWSAGSHPSGEKAGVEPQNYHHYATYVSQDSLATHASLVFNLTTSPQNRICSDCGGHLYLFLRKGALAGTSLRQFNDERCGESASDHTYSRVVCDDHTFNPYTMTEWHADGCFSSTYMCRIDSSNNGDRCVIDIPSCALSEGVYYFSVYNSDYQISPEPIGSASTTAFKRFRGYDLTAYYRPLAFDPTTLNTSFVDALNTPFCFESTEGGAAPAFNFESVYNMHVSQEGVFAHYRFHVSKAILESGCTSNDPVSCIYEKYLRMSVHNVRATGSNGPIRVFVQTPILRKINAQPPQEISARSMIAGFATDGSGIWDVDLQDNNLVPGNTAYCGTSNYYNPLGHEGEEILNYFELNIDESNEFTIHPCPLRVNNTDSKYPVLREGTYFVSLQLTQETTYEMCAELVHYPFEALTERTDEIFQDEATEVLLDTSFVAPSSTASDTQTDWYWTFALDEQDATAGNYLQFNLTNILYRDRQPHWALDAGDYLEIWRDECTADCCGACDERFTFAEQTVAYRHACSAQDIYNPLVSVVQGAADPRSALQRTVITAAHPCEIRPARYFVHLHRCLTCGSNLRLTRFSLTARLRKPTLDVTLQPNQPMLSSIWQSQYQHYKFVVNDIIHGAIAYISLRLSPGYTCGDLETTIGFGSPADKYCDTTIASVHSCGVQQTLDRMDFFDFDASDNTTCTITISSEYLWANNDGLDTDEGRVSTTIYASVRGVKQQWQKDNTWAISVPYEILAEVYRSEVHIHTPIGCDNTVGAASDICSLGGFDPAPYTPIWYVYDVESLSSFGSLRFVVTSSFENNFSPRFFVARNKPTYLNPKLRFKQVSTFYDVIASVPFRSNRDSSASANAVFIENCGASDVVGPERYYVTIFDHNNVRDLAEFDIRLERYEPGVPFITPGTVYSGSVGTLGAGQAAESYYDDAQYYRFDVSHDADEYWNSHGAIPTEVTFNYVLGGTIRVEIFSVDDAQLHTQRGTPGLCDPDDSKVYILTDGMPFPITIGDCGQSVTYMKLMKVVALDSECPCSPVSYEFYYSNSREFEPIYAPFVHANFWDGHRLLNHQVGSIERSAKRFQFSDRQNVISTDTRVVDDTYSVNLVDLKVTLASIERNQPRDRFQFTLSTEPAMCDNLGFASESHCTGDYYQEQDLEIDDYTCLYHFGYEYLAIEADTADVRLRYKMETNVRPVNVLDVSSLMAEAVQNDQPLTIDRSDSSCTEADDQTAVDYYSFQLAPENLPETAILTEASLSVILTSLTPEPATVIISSDYPTTSTMCAEPDGYCSIADSTCSGQVSCGRFATSVTYYVSVEYKAPYILDLALHMPHVIELELNTFSDFIHVPTTQTSQFFKFTLPSEIGPDEFLVFEVVDYSGPVSETIHDDGETDEVWPVLTLTTRADVPPIAFYPVTASKNALDDYVTQDIDCPYISGDHLYYHFGHTGFWDATTSHFHLLRTCDLSFSTTYYTLIQNWATSCSDAKPAMYRVRAHLLSNNVNLIPLTIGERTPGALSFHANTNNAAQWTFYHWESVLAGSVTLIGKARLLDVYGGVARLDVAANHVVGYQTMPSDNLSGYDMFSLPQFDYEWVDCSELQQSCQTGLQGSCSALFQHCQFGTNQNYYLTVSAVEQYDQRPVRYQLIVEEYEPVRMVHTELTEIQQFEEPSSDATASRQTSVINAYGNVDHFHYTLVQPTDKSLVLEIHVEGDAPQSGVWVEVSDQSCHYHDYWYQSIYCAAEYESWVCEVQIPRRYDLPFRTGSDFQGLQEQDEGHQLNIHVYAMHGSFQMRYYEGVDETCVTPGEGINFCAGFVPFPVWRWHHISQLDHEAECFYDNLYWAFYQPTCFDDHDTCDTGISFECDQELKRFACFESFPPCDQDGFITSNCNTACERVEDICAKSFSSVGLSHYACSSHRYLSDGCEQINNAISVDPIIQQQNRQ